MTGPLVRPIPSLLQAWVAHIPRRPYSPRRPSNASLPAQIGLRRIDEPGGVHERKGSEGHQEGVETSQEKPKLTKIRKRKRTSPMRSGRALITRKRTGMSVDRSFERDVVDRMDWPVEAGSLFPFGSQSTSLVSEIQFSLSKLGTKPLIISRGLHNDQHLEGRVTPHLPCTVGCGTARDLGSFRAIATDAACQGCLAMQRCSLCHYHLQGTAQSLNFVFWGHLDCRICVASHEWGEHKRGYFQNGGFW